MRDALPRRGFRVVRITGSDSGLICGLWCAMLACMSSPIPSILHAVRTYLRTTSLSERELCRRTGLTHRAFRHAKRDDWDPRASTLHKLWAVVGGAISPSNADKIARGLPFAQGANLANSKAETETPQLETTL